ncbi:MAG TPA: hypothetical protein ENN97_04365 [Phycisphaerales bacterium]|nr:hypothetical protein [Phycisphaerales bacterium]
MNRLTVVLAIGVFALGTAAQADLVNIDFDGPAYMAGQLPPEPWLQEYDGTDHSIEAEVGYEGTQGLVITSAENWAGVTYVFPAPLNSDMGAVKISVLVNPATPGSGDLFGSYGGIQVGRGQQRYDTASYLGLIFRINNGSRGVYGPGSMWGTNLGLSWSSGHWYEVAFELSQDWQNMTISVRPIGGQAVSGTFAWNGGEITRLWASTPNINSAIYDNIVVTVESQNPTGDLTGDGSVNLADVAVVAQWWMATCNATNDWCEGADLDQDGMVGIEDLLVLARHWLAEM